MMVRDEVGEFGVVAVPFAMGLIAGVF
jgi:hypothetical protein